MEPGETILGCGRGSVEEMRERVEPLMVLPCDACGAEVGVDYGVHAALLRHFLNPRKLMLVDIWHDPARYEQVLNMFRGDPRVTIRRNASLVVAGETPDESLDWIFIDANHSEEAVYQDIHAWYHKLRWNKFMILHDVFLPGVASAVRRALDEIPHLHWVAQARDRCLTTILRKARIDSLGEVVSFLREHKI